MVQNNATDKIIGFEYQKLIALEHIFNAKRSDTIFIECYGDVSDGATHFSETKHHYGNTYLSDRSVDFWKTLYNIIKDIEIFEDFSTFILHTTSELGPNTVFTNWNTDLPNVKLQKVRDILPNETIKPFHEKIQMTSDPILSGVLEKLIIKTSQPKIVEQVNVLKNHPIFNSIEINDTVAVLERLHGYISLQAIENVNRWHINMEDFLKVFQSEIKKYLIEEIQFPLVKQSQINTSEISTEFLFTKELDQIEYSSVKTDAIVHYLRASKSQILMIERSPNIVENLTQFDEDIAEEVLLVKNRHSHNCNDQNTDTKEYNKVSRQIFDDCMTLPLIPIPDVQNLKLYYQRGRIHSLVENSTFSWVINKTK